MAFEVTHCGRLLGPGDEELGDKEQREDSQMPPGGRRDALAHLLDASLRQPPACQHIVDTAVVTGRQASCARHEYGELVIVGARTEGQHHVRADRLHNPHSAREMHALSYTACNQKTLPGHHHFSSYIKKKKN